MKVLKIGGHGQNATLPSKTVKVAERIIMSRVTYTQSLVQSRPADIELDSLAPSSLHKMWTEEGQAPTSWIAHSNQDNSLHRLRAEDQITLGLKGEFACGGNLWNLLLP